MLKRNDLIIQLFLALYLVSIYVEYMYMHIHIFIMNMHIHDSSIVPGSRWNILPPGTIKCLALTARHRLKHPLE